MITETLRQRRSLMTTVEVCDLLRLSRKTLGRMTSTGKLRCVRVANKTLFDPAVVVDYIESGTIG
jgi:excisionase family DNA binding protein